MTSEEFEANFEQCCEKLLGLVPEGQAGDLIRVWVRQLCWVERITGDLPDAIVSAVQTIVAIAVGLGHGLSAEELYEMLDESGAQIEAQVQQMTDAGASKEDAASATDAAEAAAAAAGLSFILPEPKLRQ